MFGRGGTRALRPATADAALRVALADPLTNALPGSRLMELRASANALSREFSMVGPEAAMRGVLWNGANACPVGADADALDRFAERLASRGRTTSSLVGPRQAIERMWATVGPAWGRARDYRWSQPLLAATDVPAVRPADRLRPAGRGEADLVFPAAVAMFREEVGTDPTTYDGGRGYYRRITELIGQGRTYVMVEDGRVVFKADVGALFGDVAQLHGVWVDPERRGQGIARRAMAATVAQVQRDHAPRVSLYVNDYNEPARRAYAAAGFRQVGELATVLF